MTNYPREPRDEVEDQDAEEASEPTAAAAADELPDPEDQDTGPGSAPPE